jgi:non-ribosomal peptide synthetase component F
VELPGYRGPRDADSYAGETLAATIDDDLTRALRASAGRLGTTLFVVMATALVRTLSEWTGQSEIPLMTTTAERPTTESQRMLGFTANTVWVRVRADAHEPFAASAARLQDRLLAVLRHADAPTMTLLEQAFPGAFDGFPALQQVYFQVNELWHDALELRGTTNEAAEWEEPTAQPGLQLYATDRRSDIELDVHWLRGSMPRADVQRVVDAFVAELTRQASRLRETSA